jgi:Membrane domain of glycerophosphoryl diester phosphodiesterase
VSQTLRPLTIGEILDRAFVYYRRHFVMFVGIAALPNLFGLVFRLLRVVVTSRQGTLSTLLFFLAATVVSLIASTFSQGATLIAVSQIQLGRETNVREAFGRIRSQLWELVVISLNVGVRVGLGLLLLVIPGILLALRYALAIPVAVLEQNGVSASLSRSVDLTQGDRGRIFVIYVLLVILMFAGSLVWQVPALLITRMSGARTPQQIPMSAQAVTAFGSFVTQSILGPIVTIAIALVYYDERVRKEAFDLEHMMQALDGASLPSSPVA